MLRHRRCDARGKKGGLASSGMGKHGNDDRGPSIQGCQPGRIANDAARRITSTGAAATARACPEADGALRDIVRHGACRLRQQIGNAGIRGKPRIRRSRTSAANSPARPGAAQTAAGARLRAQGIRDQAGGSGSMGAPEGRLRATMLPAGGADGAQSLADAAGVEQMRDRAGSAFVANRSVTIRPAATGKVIIGTIFLLAIRLSATAARSCLRCTYSAMVSSSFSAAMSCLSRFEHANDSQSLILRQEFSRRAAARAGNENPLRCARRSS